MDTKTNGSRRPNGKTNKTDMICVRVTSEQRQYLEQAMRQGDTTRTMGQVVRDLIDKASKRKR